MVELIIRTDGDNIELCKHISIQGREVDEWEGEYHEGISMYCNECKKTHYITIVVN